MSYLNCIEIEPTTPATSSVIWLHGLGADGNDFTPIIPELNLPSHLSTRFIFPNAPAIPVTINNHMMMPAWYDIIEMNIDRKIDTQQLLNSSAAITRLIERENQRGIPSNKIILAGFSQGGAVCYQAALTHPESLAGLLTLSTYFATIQTINPHTANEQLPIQIFHGDYDPIVPCSLGENAYKQLHAWGYNVEYQTFPMEHEVCHQEIQAISKLLVQCLSD